MYSYCIEIYTYNIPYLEVEALTADLALVFLGL